LDWIYSLICEEFGVEYPTLIAVAFFLHRGSPGDARLLAEVLNELSRRRLLLTADRIVCDRGYYSYNNYAVGVLDYCAEDR
jgi:hypothetical protein